MRISAHLVEASSRTTLWSDRYDRGLEDIFAVQDEISENIAAALDQAFSRFSTRRSIRRSTTSICAPASRSYAPDELRTHVGLLEVVTQRAPHFAEAWGRLAYLRAWLHQYLPFADRAASADLVAREAARALALDPQSVDALSAQLFVLPPFGRFVEADAILERIRGAPGAGDGRRYIGWYLRTMGRVRESLEETERAYRLDALDPMSANLVALARMAAGRVAEAVPVYEDLVARMPDMSFPVSSLLRAYAFQQDWAAVDRLLALAEKRQLREFQDGLPFIRAKRDPTPENIGAWRSGLEAHVAKTGCVDVSRLVYCRASGPRRRGLPGWPRPPAWDRRAPATTSWARTPTARRCCSRPACRSCAATRASRACARGWGSSSSGWRRASGPIAPTKCPTISGPSAPRRRTSRRKPSGSRAPEQAGLRGSVRMVRLEEAMASPVSPDFPPEFWALRGEARLAVYIDLESSYAFLAIDPTRAMAGALGVDVDWRPFTLDIPSYLGSARLATDRQKSLPGRAGRLPAQRHELLHRPGHEPDRRRRERRSGSRVACHGEQTHGLMQVHFGIPQLGIPAFDPSLPDVTKPGPSSAFADSIHLTSAGYDGLAQRVYDDFYEPILVPQPASGALVALGLGRIVIGRRLAARGVAPPR